MDIPYSPKPMQDSYSLVFAVLSDEFPFKLFEHLFSSYKVRIPVYWYSPYRLKLFRTLSMGSVRISYLM